MCGVSSSCEGNSLFMAYSADAVLASILATASAGVKTGDVS